MVHIHAINLLANQLTGLNCENCLKLVLAVIGVKTQKWIIFQSKKSYLISTITSQKKNNNNKSLQ